MMDKINDDYLSRIEKISAKMDLFENFSKKELTVHDLERVYEQSVALSFFNQALIANIEVLNSLRKNYYKLIPRTYKKLFEELYHDVLQIIDTEKIQREALTNLINIQSIIASSRLNKFTKRLTTIALVFAFPTMISGIYGMNFKYIPFANHIYGFYITVVMVAITMLLMMYSLRRFKWI